MATPPEAPAAAHGQVRERPDFRPLSWLPGPHLPTIWASACRRLPALTPRHERFELADGDFVDLAWNQADAGPLVVVLHGLEGGIESRYARGILAALGAAGFRAVLMHFRGCSGEPNRLARAYHSGDTGDIAEVVRALAERDSEGVFALIGYSLGGNVVLKWLGECGAAAPVHTAVAISVPFDLAACADRLNTGFSRFYQRRLVRSMQDKYRRKFSAMPSPLRIDRLEELDTFWRYDDAVTAPLHGFDGVHDYYAQSSSRRYLRDIRVPTLILHARDDPFVPPAAIPTAAELGPPVTLELTPTGGHVGFIGTSSGDAAGYWLERRILEHLGEQRGADRDVVTLSG